MIDKNNIIKIFANENNKGILVFPKYDIKTVAFLGKNGVTTNKKEGDGKTPIGEFELGDIILGTHTEDEFSNKTILKYVQIKDNMFWVDDSKSKYYNKLVDISKVNKDWNSAEHLIDYPVQYEYLIEIKANPCNVQGNGSAIFLHCANNETTHGCVAIDKNVMEKLIKVINKDTKIEIL